MWSCRIDGGCNAKHHELSTRPHRSGGVTPCGYEGLPNPFPRVHISLGKLAWMEDSLEDPVCVCVYMGFELLLLDSVSTLQFIRKMYRF